MIILHTNLEAWDQDGVLSPFGLETSGEDFQPLMGISATQSFSKVPHDQLPNMDILLSHEENTENQLLHMPIPWGNEETLFLTLHQDEDVTVMNHILTQYPQQRILCRFESIREDPAQRNGRGLLQRLAPHCEAGQTDLYSQTLKEFRAVLESNALLHFKQIIGDKLDAIEDSLPANLGISAGIPYLWREVFRLYPDMPRLLLKYYGTHPADASEKWALSAQIKTMLST